MKRMMERMRKDARKIEGRNQVSKQVKEGRLWKEVI